MVKKIEKSLVVGLDIGTSKIVAIVGELQPDGAVEVIGLGSHPSRGLKRGVVWQGRPTTLSDPGQGVLGAQGVVWQRTDDILRILGRGDGPEVP